MPDNRFPEPGTDARFPAPETDFEHDDYPTDARFPSPDTDARFSGDPWGDEEEPEEPDD